ncbi:MAG: pyridoxal phosphate-dependent aminotransferase [Lentisphaerae bacterium]|nr:pyridoxal phosphate-dependent aminotransferase [Lentisphaerota bacterium]
MNKTLQYIQPSATLAVSAKAKELAAEGKMVCNFSAGEPDFDTPENIKEAAIKALRDGQTKYTPAQGLPELCKAVSEKFAKENGLEYAPNSVIIGGGGKMSLSIAFAALLNPGDEVIIPSPYWLSYPEMVRLANGVPVFVQGEETNSFKITPELLEAAITKKTVALIINSPSNPTGLVYTDEELAALGEVCLKHNLKIVSDEIYERMIYDDKKHVSIASISPELYKNTLTVNGVSKAQAMTGWRIGYAAGPTDWIKAMTTVQSHLASAPATFAQWGAIEALRTPEHIIKPMLDAFEARNKRIYELISEIDGITCDRPMGAFYIFPNISFFGMDSLTFAKKLISEKHVATVPGIPFGADENIRLSYACCIEEIEEGISRIKDFCKSI